MLNSSGSDFISQYGMAAIRKSEIVNRGSRDGFRFVNSELRFTKRKRRPLPAFRNRRRPPPMPPDPIPEPFGSRWSLSGHIRYIRLGTRTTVTLGSATKFKLLVQEFSES